MTKYTDEEKLAFGDEAKRMLESPTAKGVLNEIVRMQIEQLMLTVPGSPDGMKAHAVLIALDEFKKSLKILINDAAVIRNKLNKQG